MEYCECLGVRKLKDALMDIFELPKSREQQGGEFWELLFVRSWEDFKDEASDISFGIGRLVAGLFGKVYVRIPGDGAHVRKIDERMAKQGCVRSERKVAAGQGCV